MTNSYIPTRELEALQWMQAFSNGINASVSTYGLSAADGTAIANAVNLFETTLATANEPTTRTSVTIAEKDTARTSAEQICRQYAIAIKNDAGITDAAKIAIGVRPVNTSREEVNCPQSPPLLSILGATEGTQTLRFSDSNTPDSPAKPFGATSLQLFCAVLPEATTDQTQAVFLGEFTRNPIMVGFVEADDGKCASYFARWCSRRGETGQWSTPVAMRIAA